MSSHAGSSSPNPDQPTVGARPGAEDSREVFVVGLDVGAVGQAVMPRGERVHQPRFTACFAEGALHDAVIGAGHLDSDDVIAKLMLLTRVAELTGGEFELCFLMFDLGGRDQNFSIEVAQHPLGSCFGTIDGDDAEVFRSDITNPLVDDAARFSERGLGDLAILVPTGLSGLSCGTHSNNSIVRGSERHFPQ